MDRARRAAASGSPGLFPDLSPFRKLTSGKLYLHTASDFVTFAARAKNASASGHFGQCAMGSVAFMWHPRQRAICKLQSGKHGEGSESR